MDIKSLWHRTLDFLSATADTIVAIIETLAELGNLIDDD